MTKNSVVPTQMNVTSSPSIVSTSKTKRDLSLWERICETVLGRSKQKDKEEFKYRDHTFMLSNDSYGRFELEIPSAIIPMSLDDRFRYGADNLFTAFLRYHGIKSFDGTPLYDLIPVQHSSPEFSNECHVQISNSLPSVRFQRSQAQAYPTFLSETRVESMAIATRFIDAFIKYQSSLIKGISALKTLETPSLTEKSKLEIEKIGPFLREGLCLDFILLGYKETRIHEGIPINAVFEQWVDLPSYLRHDPIVTSGRNLGCDIAYWNITLGISLPGRLEGGFSYLGLFHHDMIHQLGGWVTPNCYAFSAGGKFWARACNLQEGIDNAEKFIDKFIFYLDGMNEAAKEFAHILRENGFDPHVKADEGGYGLKKYESYERLKQASFESLGDKYDLPFRLCNLFC